MKTVAKLGLIFMSALAWNSWLLPAQQVATRPTTATGDDSTATHDSDLSHGGAKIAIAWLSGVEAEVQLANSNEKEFHPAVAHMPITEGTVIQTGRGRAEVEFEDGSTVRLGQYSSIEIPRSELFALGATATSINVLKGTVYASLIPAYLVKPKGTDFQLKFGLQVLHLQPSSHIRVELDATGARLAVLDGKGSVEGPFGTIGLVKKRTFVFNLEDQSELAMVKKVSTNPLDAWDRSAVTVHQNKAGSGKKDGSTVDRSQRNPWCNLYQCAPA
ncbi:FecR domain-containing protein [Alloacidobacterium sp.]|uniref:FecR domain-containing protein n=1 Tax=Alloacidobacterium sp. TaxID=2951999 RepID=UPI002D4B98C8|nr:FecR domain-containing protein [Alloacidobacterium sp.]HYK34332.1 FecR domain-containing protein [Alloacidobacterium sp.]